MAFYDHDAFPAKYRGGAFVAFHGSWNRAPLPQAGFNVAFVPFDEKGMPRGGYEVFADGFAGQGPVESLAKARFRPGGVAIGPDGSLYVSDTQKGRVWRIFHTGEEGRGKAARAARPRARATAEPDKGAALYEENCAVCHMEDGAGAPGMQPPLKGSRMVTGEPQALVKLLVAGPDAALPAERPRFQNEMPTFEALSDEDLAALTVYVRRVFGGKRGPVSAAQVKDWR
jgi:mono/diheme cytochrome c family protein